MTSISKFRIAVLTTAAAISMLSFNANAGTASGKLGYITSTRNTLFAFNVGAIADRPACAASNEFAIDNSTAAGKAMIASILAAQAQGLVINVSGSGNCDVWGDRESAGYVSISFPN
jgi:hypothetical protein